MDGEARWAAVHGVSKSWTRLSDFTFTFHFHALEKEMATHSSVLAWRIPGTGEPGGLPSVGSHRVGHNWSDLAIEFQNIYSHRAISMVVINLVCYHWMQSWQEVCTVSSCEAAWASTVPLPLKILPAAKFDAYFNFIIPRTKTFVNFENSNDLLKVLVLHS